LNSSLTRKNFLSLIGTGIFPTFFGNIAFADNSNRDILIYVFLRGGCDALNFLPPLSGEDRKVYEEERPNLKISLTGSDALIPLDSRFGLHPSAKPLAELFQEKKLAFVHAAGLTANTRSHFEAQSLVELGTPDKKTTGSGWIARYLETIDANGDGYLPAVSLGGLNPASLLSFSHALSLNDPKRMNLVGDKSIQGAQRAALKSMYRSKNSWLHKAGQSALNALDLVESRDPNTDLIRPGIEYPKGEIGNRLKILSQLLKMGLGIQIATVDMGGWDTHKYQGVGTEGTYAKQVEQLSSALHALYSDLNDSTPNAISKKVTIVVMTEFGRRLRENANRGTDHGHGGMMMILGDHVRGGKVYGKWPGLHTDQLYERADLAVSTDFRQVLTEVIIKRLKNNRIATIFPSYSNYSALNLIDSI